MENESLPSRAYDAGDVIYSYSDKGTDVFLIHTGKISIVSKHGLTLGEIGEGEIFGEVNLIIASLHSVTAIAKEATIIKVIPRALIVDKIEQADPVVRGFMRSLGIRLRDSNELAEKFWNELNLYKSLED